MSEQQDEAIKLALRELYDMLDGGDECQGRDSQLSHVIGILKRDPNHLFLARRDAARQVERMLEKEMQDV